MHHKFKHIKIHPKENLEEISKSLEIVSKSSHTKNCLKFLNVFDSSIYLIEYAPKIFRNVLKLDSLTHEEILKSFDIKSNIANISNLSLSEGKSGSFFFFTHDNRFIIKTISSTELNTLQKEFMKPYYELITENYNTLLARTYGVYSLKVGLSKVDIILMENVAPIGSDQNIIRRFDLKGSLLGRMTKKMNFNQKSKTLKDKDFLELKRIDPMLIMFEDKSIISILETLKYDLNLLRNCSLMDYSIFITIAENKKDFELEKCLVHNRLYYSKNEKYIYFIGIIDYLTKFNKTKQFENKFKTLMNYSKRKTISAVNPLIYAQRFSEFIQDELFHLKDK
jgi:1-phosphatidylinositol-4-phosphate 5-kinase